MASGGGTFHSLRRVARQHQKKTEKKRKPPSNTNPPKRPTAEAAVCANRRTSHETPVCSFGFYCVNSTECKQEKKQLKNRDVIFFFACSSRVAADEDVDCLCSLRDGQWNRRQGRRLHSPPPPVAASPLRNPLHA